MVLTPQPFPARHHSLAGDKLLGLGLRGEVFCQGQMVLGRRAEERHGTRLVE